MRAQQYEILLGSKYQPCDIFFHTACVTDDNTTPEIFDIKSALTTAALLIEHVTIDTVGANAIAPSGILNVKVTTAAELAVTSIVLASFLPYIYLLNCYLEYR